MSRFVIGDREGCTPLISHLVTMMAYTRETTLDAVRGLSRNELDARPCGSVNSVAMLLEHMAAVEVLYQAETFEGRDLTSAELKRWQAGLELGRLGQARIRDRDLETYLDTLASVRARTEAELRRRNDVWLLQETPFWGGQRANTYFKWFHVMEDELNHRGQIRLLRRLLHP